MKIKCLIKLDNGNLRVITDTNLTYGIGNDADYGQPYGICLPNTDFFVPLTKGIGLKIYKKILKQMEVNKSIPVFYHHNFTPSLDDSNFCGKCNQYLTHETHKRNSIIHPLFEPIK